MNDSKMLTEKKAESLVAAQAVIEARKAMEAEAEAQAMEPAFEAPEVLGVEDLSLTYGEYLDMEVSVPVFQRPPVWSEKWKADLRESVFKGYPLPALILVKVTQDSGRVVHLLIDGVQRTTCLEAIQKDIEDEGTQYSSDSLDYLLSYPVSLMVVEASSLEVAADLFIRYNSGNRLSGAQKGKASLPPEIIEACEPFTEIAKLARLAKFKTMSPDTMGVVLAAAMVCQYTPELARKATSSGASAVRVLKKHKPVNPALIKALPAVFEAVGKLEPGQRSTWASASMLIPLCLAFDEVKHDVTAAEALAFMAQANLTSNARYDVRYNGRGKEVVKENMSIAKAFGNDFRGSGAKDNSVRTYMLKAMIRAWMRGDRKTEAEVVAEEKEAELAEAVAMLNSL